MLQQWQRPGACEHECDQTSAYEEIFIRKGIHYNPGRGKALPTYFRNQVQSTKRTVTEGIWLRWLEHGHAKPKVLGSRRDPVKCFSKLLVNRRRRV